MHYLRSFLRKLVFDLAPAALASLIGAALFTQPWKYPAPPAPATAAIPAEQVMTLIRAEHDRMTGYLALEQDRFIAALKETQDATKEATKETMKEAAKEAAKEVTKDAAKDAKAASAMAQRPAADRRPVELAARESVPLPRPNPVRMAATSAEPALANATAPPPAPRRDTLDMLKDTVADVTEKAIAVSHVREIVSFIRDIPGRIISTGDRSNETASEDSRFAPTFRASM